MILIVPKLIYLFINRLILTKLKGSSLLKEIGFPIRARITTFGSGGKRGRASLVVGF